MNRVSNVAVLLVPDDVVVHGGPVGACEDLGEPHLKLLQAVATLVEVYCMNEWILLLLAQNILRLLVLRHILALHFILFLIILQNKFSNYSTE